MKRSLLITLCASVAFVASAQAATKVTNLDHVPHIVVYEAAGSVTKQQVQPNQSIYFFGQPDGFMSLISAQQPKPSKGTLHADGMLSGVIGVERTEDIPVTQDDTLAIWPGGQLMIQSTRHPSHLSD